MAGLVRTDPFRDLDRLTQQVFGTTARPAAMPIDAYRRDDVFVVRLDLPGVGPGTVDLDVERSVLTVRAERPGRDVKEAGLLVAERPRGAFGRRLLLGDSLDPEKITAHYDAGVLSVKIPVTEEARPRRIEIGRKGAESQQTESRPVPAPEARGRSSHAQGGNQMDNSRPQHRQHGCGPPHSVGSTVRAVARGGR